MEVEQNALDICDDYEHSDSNVDYVLENVLSPPVNADNCEEYQHLKQKYNSILLNGCECSDTEHNCYFCFHGGNYTFNSQSKELVLNTDKSNELIYECSSVCKCDSTRCLNRLVQKGPRNALKVINSEVYGSKGLITTDYIPKGGYICEYAGEILTHKEALRRQNKNLEDSLMNYVLFLNEFNIEDKHSSKLTVLTTIIDPSKRGNIGRYINHSCDPNCEIRSVRVDCPIPKIGIFAKRSIMRGEELCFHYNEGLVETKTTIHLSKIKGTLCLCGAPKCSGYLPSASI